jgi:hypothetical protein
MPRALRAVLVTLPWTETAMRYIPKRIFQGWSRSDAGQSLHRGHAIRK